MSSPKVSEGSKSVISAINPAAAVEILSLSSSIDFFNEKDGKDGKDNKKRGKEGKREMV